MTPTNKAISNEEPPHRDFEKMVSEINDLVETDFSFDMSCKRGLPDQKDFTQDEAKEMAGIIGQVYSIAHGITCICGNKYAHPNPNKEHQDKGSGFTHHPDDDCATPDPKPNTVEVIERWVAGGATEYSVDGGETWWTKEQYKILTHLIQEANTELISKLEKSQANRRYSFRPTTRQIHKDI